MKVWTSTDKNDDKIIVYQNETIFKANPPVNKIDEYLLDLKLQNSPSHNFLGIPISYISEINIQEGKKHIEVIFKGDYEYFRIGDDKKRNEIFDYFKQNIPGATQTLIRQSKIQAVKKPLIGMIVTILIALWALYIANGIENGNQYDVTGQNYHSVAGIILVIASLGVNNILLLFGTILSLILYSLIKKYKNPIEKTALLIKS